jgi:hypothetical protein
VQKGNKKDMSKSEISSVCALLQINPKESKIGVLKAKVGK